MRKSTVRESLGNNEKRAQGKKTPQPNNSLNAAAKIPQALVTQKQQFEDKILRLHIH